MKGIARWRSVLLHEDTVPIAPGQGLHYVLDAPLVDVTGISCQLRFKHPCRAVTSSVPILRLGDEFELSLEPLTSFQALVRVRLHRAWHDIGQLPNPSTRFAELRFDWHTGGKTYLRVDGRLVGYHDALSRGARLTIADISFGSPDPSYELGGFFVRARYRRPLRSQVRRSARAWVTAQMTHTQSAITSSDHTG
jgi:hypothetical protein